MATNPRKNPCPDCGPSAPLTVRVGADASRHVYCRSCGYMGPSEENAKMAIYAHNLGTVRGERRPELTLIHEQFILDRSMPEPNSGCWLWMLALNEWGYGLARLDGAALGAHRASWIATNGAIPPGLWVLHKCDNACCVNPDHLYLGTVIENVRDAVKRNRLNRWNGRRSGEANPRAKLTVSDVREIRALSRCLPAKDLANRYGVSTTTISSIAQRRRWSHVD